MKNVRGCRIARTLAGMSLVLILGACAVPATEVAVETMPMQKALEISRSDGAMGTTINHNVPPIEKRTLPPALQGALLSTPDVRLAYLYEWIDTDGNKHYGEWVAIPISSSRWVMSDGSQTPMEPNPADPAAAPESQ